MFDSKNEHICFRKIISSKTGPIKITKKLKIKALIEFPKYSSYGEEIEGGRDSWSKMWLIKVNDNSKNDKDKIKRPITNNNFAKFRPPGVRLLNLLGEYLVSIRMYMRLLIIIISKLTVSVIIASSWFNSGKNR